jgi:1-acyl-sn-glycerol-3-phosphate acyltransferase
VSRRTSAASHDQLKPSPPEQALGVRALRAWNYLFCRTYHRLTIVAPPRLPSHGPAIVVCNHVGSLDPLLIQSACARRMVVWMMAKEYYDIRSIAWVFRTMQVIGVDRGARDTVATRAALRTLDEGKVLGIFPEGRIETSRDLLPFQTGVAMLAAKTGVPIHPAYLDGTHRGHDMIGSVARPCRAKIRFGLPIRLDPTAAAKDALEPATAIIQAAVERLRRAAMSEKTDVAERP